MVELNDFYNDGFGWICKHCERELKTQKKETKTHSRLLSEGEAESKKPEFSTSALAKWVDKTNRALMCPRCGIVEAVENF